MGLESPVNFISDLVATNPLPTDPKSQGDDHIRNIKVALQGSFPNVDGAVNLTPAQFNSAAIKGEANVFAFPALGANFPASFESAAPLVKFSATGAALNEKNWTFGSQTGQFYADSRADDNSAGQTWLTVDRTGTDIDSVTLWTEGIGRLETLPGGIVGLRSNGSTDAEVRLLEFRHSDGAVRGRIGHNGNGQFTFESLINGEAVQMRGNNAAGVTRAVLIGDPDGQITAFHNGLATLRTQAAGIDIAGANPLIGLHPTSFGARSAYLQANAVSGVLLQNELLGLPVTISGTNVGGAARTLFSGDPDGNVTAYYAGSPVFIVGNGKGTIRSVSGSGEFLGFETSSAVREGFISQSPGSFLMRNEVHGAPISLQGEDAGGIVRELIMADPDGSFSAYHAGTLAIQSADHTLTDQVTSARVTHNDGVTYPVGIAPAPPVNITVSTTVTQAHVQKMLRWTGGAAGLDVTLPNVTTLPVGSWGMIRNASTSSKDIVAGTGATVTWIDGNGGQAGNRALAPGSAVTWWLVADGIYEVWGNGLS